MVNLPKASDAIVTSQVPTSAVTPGVIQQQANDRAAAIDKQAGATSKIADGLMDVATDAAKNQAANDLMQQKVTRDADGNVTVQNPASAPLIFGDAGKAYADAVKVGTVAQYSNSISQDFADLHQQFPTDPQAFRKAAQAHLDKTAQAVTGPMGEAIQAQGSQLLTQHLNAITSAAASTDVATQNSAISANQQSARDDVMAMVRGGTPITDPALQGKIAQYDAATERRAANPLFNYSKEQAQLDRETFHSTATANAMLYRVDKVYKDQGAGGGYAGAMETAKDILTNPGYKLSEQDRESYYHKAVADIRANEALRRQDVSEAQAAFQELTLASAGGRPIDSDQVEFVAKAFRDAGAPGRAAQVYSSFIRKPLNDDFGRQPLSAQTQQLAALQGANASAAAHRFFIGKGYTPEQSAGIVGNLIHESGVDPKASGDNGTSGGLAQFHNERLTALRKFADERGKPATDFTTQLEFIDKELHSTEGATLAKLQAAKTPEDAAGAFINYERPQGWTPENPAGGLGYESRKALARTVFNGRPGPTDQSMGPAGSMWLEANRQSTLGTAAQTQWATIMRDYKAEGTRPAPQLVTDIVNSARVSRNTDLLDTIAHDTARMDLARELSRSPLPMQHDAVTTLESAGAAGDLSPGHATLLKDLQHRNAAITKGLEENPIATTVQNFPDKLKPPGPLDFSSEAALAGSISNRAAIAQFGALNWNSPALSILDQADLKQVQAALQSPQGGSVLTTISNVTKPDEMRKLLDDKGFRDSVVGMQSSLDVSKMTAANTVADKMWRTNPALAESVLGSKSIEKMQAWSALRDTFEAPELAKMLNRNDDPSLAAARKDAITAANEETTKLSTGDMAYRLGSGSWLLGRLTGNTPDVPYDSVQGSALVGEYRAAYAQLRAMGVPADHASIQATDRLRSTWGVSAAAGNRLMKNAPEMSQAYPAIGGTKDWINDQLHDWIVQRRGPEMLDNRRSAEVFALAGREQNWSVEGLISDGTTASQMTNHQPPSYQVAIRINGALEILPERITFDPAKAIDGYEKGLSSRLQTLNTVRANQFSLGTAMP